MAAAALRVGQQLGFQRLHPTNEVVTLAHETLTARAVLQGRGLILLRGLEVDIPRGGHLVGRLKVGVQRPRAVLRATVGRRGVANLGAEAARDDEVNGAQPGNVRLKS